MVIQYDGGFDRWYKVRGWSPVLIFFSLFFLGCASYIHTEIMPITPIVTNTVNFLLLCLPVMRTHESMTTAAAILVDVSQSSCNNRDSQRYLFALSHYITAKSIRCKRLVVGWRNNRFAQKRYPQTSFESTYLGNIRPISVEPISCSNHTVFSLRQREFVL